MSIMEDMDAVLYLEDNACRALSPHRDFGPMLQRACVPSFRNGGTDSLDIPIVRTWQAMPATTPGHWMRRRIL